MSWLRRREVFGSSKSRAGDYSRIYTSLYSSIGKQANSQYDYGGIFNLEFSYDGWVFILHFSCARSIPKPEHKQLLFSSSLCCNITLLTRESTPRRKCIWRDSNFKNAISDSMLDIDIGGVHSTQWHRRPLHSSWTHRYRVRMLFSCKHFHFVLKFINRENVYRALHKNLVLDVYCLHRRKSKRGSSINLRRISSFTRIV